MLTIEPKQILNFKADFFNEENTLKAITIREIYRSQCNEHSNKHSLRRIKKAKAMLNSGIEPPSISKNSKTECKGIL